MHPILVAAKEKGKSFVEDIGDNGPDMDPTNYINIFYWRRLWRDTNLTRLSCISYTSGHSPFNPIEHAWSPLSNKLTSVTLRATLLREDKPPHKQTDLTTDEISKKNKKMLENAADELASHWGNLTYDGNSVVPLPIKNTNEVYNDHNNGEIFVNAPLRDLDRKELKPLRKEFKVFCRHVDRRRNALSFMKCQLIKNDSEICDECRKSPPKDFPAFQFEKSIGGLMFDPQSSDDLKGQFKAYLEMVNCRPDDLPKYTPQQMLDLGRCSICKN